MGIDLILGNIFSVLAMISDSISSSRKTAKGVLIVQTVSQVFYTASTIILKGYSGAVQNAVSIFRNLEAIREKPNKIMKWVWVALGVILGICFNNLGAIGWLPVIGNLIYSLAVFYFKNNERALKMVFACIVIMFGIFNFVIRNYVGVGANIFIFVSTIIFLIRDKKSDNKNKKNT
ncbi:MAG: YgjV family protein [Clostridia bacterium]|nr:YgjV family protein [Clostridia bacterium]